jgi:hypothetical protein
MNLDIFVGYFFERLEWVAIDHFGDYLHGRTDNHFSFWSCSYGFVAIISRISLFGVALMASLPLLAG